MKIKKKKKKNLGRNKNRGERKEKKRKNNDVAELNYFLLFLNDHVSNFYLPRK